MMGKEAMTDIVERLQRGVDTNELPDKTDYIMREAADEIKRLREEVACVYDGKKDAEIKQLRAVLEKIASLRHSNSSAASIAQSALDTMKALQE